MTLAEYLKQPDCTATDLARKTNTAVSTITRVARGEQAPSHALMEAIHRATKGAVKPNDFFGIAA